MLARDEADLGVGYRLAGMQEASADDAAFRYNERMALDTGGERGENLLCHAPRFYFYRHSVEGRRVR